MKKGIAFAGNLIVDCVKMIDAYPEKGMLCSIGSISQAIGGCAANTAADVAIMDPSLPVRCIGLTGKDQYGDYIRQVLSELGIDLSMVKEIDAPTSFTDVMTLRDTGERTFFQARGANAHLGPEHLELEHLQADILHLGYALLLDRFDQPDPEYGTVMARTLAEAQRRGIRTSIDVVSEASDRFERLVSPSLRYCNYVILNEVESSQVTHIAVREKDGTIREESIQKVCTAMFELGVKDLVVIHAPEGGWCMDKEGRFYSEPSVDVPKGYIKGKVGAGDAFCAGVLYGIYQGWDCSTCLRLGGAAAAANLSAPDSISGMRPVEQLWSLEQQFKKDTCR